MTKTILAVHTVTVAHAADAAEAAGQSVSPGAIVYIVICVSLVLTVIMAILRPFVPLIATALSAVASLLGAAGRWLSTLVRSPLCALLQLAQFLLTLGGFALVGWGVWEAFHWSAPDTNRPLVVAAFVCAVMAWFAGSVAQVYSERFVPLQTAGAMPSEDTAGEEDTAAD